MQKVKGREACMLRTRFFASFCRYLFDVICVWVAFYACTHGISIMCARAGVCERRSEGFGVLEISNFAVNNLSAAKNMLCREEARW